MKKLVDLPCKKVEKNESLVLPSSSAVNIPHGGYISAGALVIVPENRKEFQVKATIYGPAIMCFNDKEGLHIEIASKGYPLDALIMGKTDEDGE